MTDLIAELAEVRSKREAWAASLAEEAWNELALLAVNFTAHHAEIEAMARDAARYRWMRELQACPFAETDSAWDGLDALDAAIDSDMAAMHDSAREDGNE